MTDHEGHPPRPLRIALGSDNAGLAYKDAICADFEADPRVASISDVGVGASDDDTTYPDIAVRVGELIASGQADRGLLVCGTGIGVAIAANKVPGIRATVAHDSYSVERSVLSNDCQVLTLGERVIGLELARRLADEWLGYVFDPESGSKKKVDRIINYERDRETDVHRI